LLRGREGTEGTARLVTQATHLTIELEEEVTAVDEVQYQVQLGGGLRRIAASSST